MAKFKEIGKIKIGENKFLVLSEDNDNNIVMTQMYVVNDNGEEIPMFTKNSIRIPKDNINDLLTKIEDYSILK